MNVELQVWLTPLCALLTILMQALSTLLDMSGPIRIRHWLIEAGTRFRSLGDRPARLTAFRTLLDWTARLAAIALLLALWQGGSGWRLGLSVLVVAALLLLVEVTMRVVVIRASERTLEIATPFLRLVYLVLYPLIGILAAALPVRRPAPRNGEEEDEATADEIESFIRVGTREGILEPGEEDLVWRIVDFGDSTVHKVMTPRTDMICAPVESGLEELKSLFLDCKHARIPLYEGSIDNIVGIIHLRDVVAGLDRDPRPAAQSLAKQPVFVPDTKSLPPLLRQFQAQHQQMAIAVDEYGGTAGLVTVEDLLEEIVGEIMDEHEAGEPLRQALPDGGWRLAGALPVETLHELFGVDSESMSSETVGGLVFNTLGELPEPGREVTIHGLVFRVERVGSRRIRTVTVHRRTAEA